MDTLHSMLSHLRSEAKATPKPITVFREFLAHLDQMQRAASPVRAGSPRPHLRKRAAKRPK